MTVPEAACARADQSEVGCHPPDVAGASRICSTVPGAAGTAGLADLPVELLGRLRSDQVMWLPAPARDERPRKHGRELALSDPAACPHPRITTSTANSRCGPVMASASDWGQPGSPTAAWLDHDWHLPVI